MKKHWLRGLLLAVSLALLLGGGVALAASAHVDKGCFQCIPLEYRAHPEDIPYDPYLFTITGSTWNHDSTEVDVDFYFPGGTRTST